MHAQREGGFVTPLPPALRQRRVTGFRSRRSALTPAQQQTWDRLWPQLGTEARAADGRPAGPPGL